jgi:branched-chain amino acid transport system substrate-binding protein
MSVFRAIALVALPALLLAGCPPAHRQVRDGWGGEGSGEPTKPAFEPKKIPEADRALEEAAARAEQGKKQAAIDAYLAVRTSYPESTAGQDALFRVGIFQYEAGEWSRARAALNELVFENPLHERALEARLYAGLSALELGAFRDAHQALTSVSQRLEGPLKQRAVQGAERAALEGGLHGEALKLALRRVEGAGGEARAQALEEITRIVDAQAPFVEIARAQADLSTGHPAWPILTFKLARIYYHLRDWPRLNETLEAFLRHAPDHAFASQAQELLARSQRRSHVRPKTVGVILPMTGRFRPVGEAALRGVQLALLGSDIELVVKDSQGDVMIAGKAVEELVFEDGAMAIIGPILADDSRRAALVAEELQIPILTLTRQEDITELGPWVFRNMLTNSAQARALAGYATDVLGFKNFAILYPDISYGQDLTNLFWDELDRRGATVRGAESYAHDQTTFTSETKKLVGRFHLEDRHDYQEGVREIQSQTTDAFRRRKALERLRSQLDPIVDFEALFIPDEWRRVGLVAPALAVEDIITNACDPRDLERIRKTTGKKDLKTVTLLGTNLWSSPKDADGMPQLISRGGKFVTCSIYVDGFYPDSARPGTRRFMKAWRDGQHRGEPGLLEATGYDAAGIVRAVVQQGPRTREDFRERLAALKDFEGATGTTTFDDTGDAQKPLFILSVDQKAIREVEPPKKVTGT